MIKEISGRNGKAATEGCSREGQGVKHGEVKPSRTKET